MQTFQRLTRAYEQAHVVEFDAASKFVFLSDQHRGDGSRADEFAPNKMTYAHALDHYLAQGFTLVEAGDSEDLWEFPHIRHIVRANGLVYARLRKFHEQGRYVRLYGNHDAQLTDPRYVRQNFAQYQNPHTGAVEPLFPGLEVLGSLLLRERTSGQELLVVHGHQGDFANDQNWRMTMTSFRMFWRWLHAFGIKSPSSPIRNSYKRHKVERNYVKWIRAKKVSLLCGHTHRARLPLPDESPYFNSGSATFNGYVTGIEIADGAIALVRWRVEPNADGYLHVVRSVLGGPIALAEYDRRSRPGLDPDAELARREGVREASRRQSPRKDGRRTSGL